MVASASTNNLIRLGFISNVEADSGTGRGQGEKGSKRVKGIEPSCPAWEAGVLPLNYTRDLEEMNSES